MQRDWQAIREDFPILREQARGKPLVYLDNAASTQKPRAVIDALTHYYEHDNANVHRGLHELSTRATEAYEGARAKVAKYLGAANADEIVFTRGTTEGINLISQAWGGKYVKAGDTILLTEMEHHSNIVPWQLLAERVGATIRYLPVLDDGTLAMERLAEFLAPGVKVFSFTHISNSLGTVNPVAELCRAAREVGALSVVDAAQSGGHMPVNVGEIGCDFLAFSGHKMCAPTGIGALYGKRERLEETPPYHGGGEMILSVTYEGSTYKEPPHRFEAGTPNIAGAVGLGAAIDYIEAIGRDRIFKHDEELALGLIAGLEKIPGARVYGPRDTRGGLVGFSTEWAHPHDLTTFANEHGFALRGGHHCNQPLMRKMRLPGTTRASFYFYNTRAEADRLLEVLTAAHKFFA